MKHQLRLLIVGSCVSRDVLNYDADGRLLLIDYFARSSFASMFTSIAVNDRFSAYIPSEFQRRIVRADLLKELSSSLVSYEFDLLLVDLIDERFSLFEFPDGALCTLSNELLSSGFNPQIEQGRIIKSGTVEFFTLWKSGWNQFIDIIKKAGFLHKVRLNATFWAKSTVSGDNFLPTYTESDIERSNLTLTAMYDCIKKDLNQSQLLFFDEELTLFSANQHRWGKSPFHLTDRYYEDILSRLKRTMPIDEVRQAIKSMSDLDRWGGLKSSGNDIDGFVAGLMREEGVHRIELISDVYLDCYIKGFEGFEMQGERKNVLVGLSGAVSNRSGKKAPFFSGLGISTEMSLPVIAISDPTLALDNELAIAWYAGFQGMQDLPIRVALLLDALSKRMNAHFILFGGSGGGFAAISIMKLMISNVSALVWNPQTAIDEYVPSFVNNYINIAFPSIEHKDECFMKDKLAKAGVIYNIRNIDGLGEGKRLLFLQNKSDWHFIRHAIPFLDNIGFGDDFAGQWRNGVYFLAHDFGDGHAVPSKIVLLSSLKFLTGEYDESLFLAQVTKPRKLSTVDAVVDAISFQVFSFICEKKIIANIILDASEEPLDCVFAFYLLREGVKYEVRGYDKLNTAVFDLPADGTDFEIVGYVKRKEIRTLRRIRVDLCDLRES